MADNGPEPASRELLRGLTYGYGGEFDRSYRAAAFKSTGIRTDVIGVFG